MATTPRARATTPPNRPMSVIMAYADGKSSADKWLERSADTTVATAPVAEWRAHAFAEFVQKHQNRRDFFQLLGEWESGFDERVRDAEAYQQSVRPTPRDNSIKRISDDANTVAALLSVVGVLPEADQPSALVTCYNLARGVASGLGRLVGGAS